MFPILDCAQCLISRFSKFDPKLDTSVVLCAAAVGDWLVFIPLLPLVEWSIISSP